MFAAPANETDKDRYTLIEQSSILLKQQILPYQVVKSGLRHYWSVAMIWNEFQLLSLCMVILYHGVVVKNYFELITLKYLLKFFMFRIPAVCRLLELYLVM